MPTGADLVAAARGWIGTPFVHQARRRGVGVDCLNLIRAVIEEVGLRVELDPEELRAYGPPRPDLLVKRCEAHLDRVLGERRLGDLLLIAFPVWPQHLAFVSSLDPARVIHACSWEAVRAVAENGLPLAGSRIVRTYRFRGLA